MNNDQLRAMYNGFGTLNRPQNYGDDVYNDRENMMPSAGQELTQTGTDEAGNPVMAPAAMPEAPQQEQAPLDNLIDFARNRMQQSQNRTDLSAFGAMAPIAEGMRDLWNATPEERAQMLNVPQRMENAVRGVIHSMSNATELEHTQLYENYFYNPQRKNDEINRIAKLLQIDGNAFANNRELYQKAALAADRVERMGKFKKYQDAEGNIDMAKIYADIPGLTEIQQQQGTAAAALALGNIDGVRSINDVYDNAFSRFVGSVYAGARRGWISDRRSAIWNDARKEARLPNAEEQKELDAYDAELRELPKYNYNTVGNVAGAMVGGAAENLAMIVKSQGAGMAARVAVGRLGGARAGDIASNVVSTYMMAQDIAGQQYEELINKTDAYGRPMYTPEQASRLALAQGAGEAVLEQYSLNQMGKAIFGRSAAPALRDIIKNSPTLEAAKAGVREYASTKIREATKAGLISLGAEAAEEFNQAASDMLMENVAQVMINGQDAQLSSIDDILTASTGQMLEALPAIGGFGLIGFGANPIANTRAVLGFRSHVRDVVNNKILIGRMANAHYGEVLSGVWDNKKNIKELQDKAPEVAQTILDAQNKIAGIESGFVDVKALQQQEGGDALVKDIAERNNVSEDELAACLDGSGMLQVKTSTLMQMDLQDAQRKAIMDNVTTSLDAFTEAQTNAAIKLVQEQMNSLQNFNDKTYKAAVDNIIAARFPDAEQARLAREIIETNYDNPQEEFKRRLDAVNAEMDEYVGPVLKELRSGMKQGVDIIRMEDGRDAGYVKQSNNAEWYRNWFADNGRAPNNEELLGLAIDIASGRQNARYGLQDYQNNTEESRQYFGNVAQILDRLEEQRNALMAIQDRMRDLNPGEMVATASLSKEGLKVYDTMRRMMGESGNADVQKAGRFNALFLARYADNMAKVFSQVRNTPYTAEDFVRDRFRLDTNAVYNQENQQEAAQLFQVSPEEFARQKAEVRKQYEGTDQWMKAPNGKDTNLTEDQWVTVRTDAFKNWFGDWENDPDNASKIVDKNGEPKPLYHGTKMAEFNEFNKGNIFMTDDKVVADWYAGTENVADKRTLTLDTKITKKPIDEVIKFINDSGKGNFVKLKDSDLLDAVRYKYRYDFEKKYVDQAAEKISTEKERTDLTDAEKAVLDIAEKNVKLLQKFTQGKGTAKDVKKSIEYTKQAYDVRDKLDGVVESMELSRYIRDIGMNQLPSVVYKEGDRWVNADARWVQYTEEDLRTRAREILRNRAEGGVYPLFANIRNPLIMDAGGAGWRGLPLSKISGNPDHASVPTDTVGDYAKENGYDGAIIQDVNDMSVVDYHPADDIIAFEPNQIKDATGRNVGFDPQSGNIYLQMAGENAVNAPLEELQKAKKMEQEGKDEYDIWRETGWVKGKDDRWRFEIKDSLRDINLNKLVDSRIAQPLSAIYSNSILYDAYPQLANLVVVGDESLNEGDTKGYYDPATNEIHVSTDFIRNDEVNAKLALIHEVQHAIQRIEGFSGGASPEAIKTQLLQEGIRITKEMQKISGEATPVYYNLKRNLELAKLNRTTGKATAEDVKNAEEKLAAFENKSTLTEEQKNTLWKLGNRRAEIEKQIKLAEVSPIDAYMLVAGEQEARETSVRAKLREEYYNELDENIKSENEALDVLNSAVSKLSEKDKDVYKKYVNLANETDADKLPDNYTDILTQLERDLPSEVVDAFNDYQMAVWEKGDAMNIIFGRGDFPRIHSNDAIVIFGSSVEKANSLYQQGRSAKGSISLNQQGQRIISLFESADQSTFIHEMSHMFLLDLQEVAGIDPNSRQAKDLKTIMDWAEYKPGQADEYKGTASAEEFRRRDAEIQAAEKAGNAVEAQRLKDVWAQERFARGFEEYLKSGEAPAAGLKNAFRQFKKWLIQIYNDVLGAGVRATPEVEAIMARMVASEEEIDAMEAANNIARLRKVDPDILSEDAQALRDRWQEEAKEHAKEKMLKELMKQYEQQNLKDLDKRLEDVRTAAREEMQNVPCFVCEQLLKDGTDMASALEICGFASEQEYKDALQTAGGSMEKALDNTVAQARENMLTAMPSKDALYTMAEEALLSGDYNIRLAELEAEMLKAREAAYQNAPARLRRALTEVDEAIRTFETQAVRQAVQKLKYAERWGAKDLQTIQELEKHLADLDKADATKEERQKVKDQFEAKYKELKRRTVQNEQWLRNVRDATDGKVKALRIMARAQMASQQLSAATNPRYWHRQALSEGKAAWQEITRAQRKGEEVNARAAVTAKETQAYYDAMTAEAITNRKKVDRLLNSQRGIKARGKRMADPKVKADANMRYYHNHLLYIFGLRNSDAIAPSQVKTFTEVLAELRASHQFEEEVPAWLIAAADATTQDKNYQQLTLGEFEELDKLTRVLYTLARNQNQLLTLDVDMDTVVADCGADWMNHVDYEVGNQRINEVKGAIGDYMNGLLKPEVLLSIMGGKDGGFIKYIYRVLFKAAEAEEIAREKEAAAQKELYKAFYTQQELRAMVNDPVMVEGPDGNKVKLQIGDDTDITKENLICMALNWGNEANRARLVVGLFDCENDAELAERQEELMGILANTLTEKDWQFVQAMWDHINTFATPVSEVLEKSIGVPLDRVKADAFTVDLPDGTQLNMAGGYYPIVKDSSKSSRQSEFDQLEEAKAVGGVSVFGTGMSATKARADNLFLNQGPLKLTLDVASKHITAQIHLIHAKMAVRDAYKVLNDKTIKEMIRRTCGEGTVKSMNEWVLNCWAPPVRPHSWYESMAAQLRSKTVGAIMGYRVSTALLNLANVVYMAQEIGTKNALAAMADFYQHPFRNRQQILDVSVFMRNRATNMDRDLGAQEEQLLKRHNMVGNAIDKATGGKSEEMRYLMDKYANWLIEQTDMLVSMPLYQWQYKETYSQQIQDGVPEEQAREAANFEATRRVTKVFGSSRALDTSAVQRSKNEIVKLITPFFTFANTMMNAVWSHYYEGKYTADKKTFRRRYAAFTRAILFNFVLGALVETMLRQVPDILAGTGGDDDDDKFMKTVGKNVLANAVAGFPGVNELINTSYELFTEKKSYGSGRGVGVLSGSLERGIKVIQDAAKLTQGSDKIDAVDFFRDVARAVNVKTGMSDTITDAVFNTVRFASDNYSLDNMDDLREYIAKSIFDRKLKKK